MPYSYDYPRPAVTVDLIILHPSSDTFEVLLIRRGREPFKGCWALPGGFLDMDEELVEAAARELAEETNLKGIALTQMGAFGKIGRDPRGRTVSVVYQAVVDEKPEAQAGDDADEAQWFSLHSLPELAFDHQEILAALRASLPAAGRGGTG